ncbi:hypothetical protein SLEP1_g56665 [Rubroshorea leprosula]|uniref:Uncharacterized protein n=1 Tax=Rubroshorea leprosula TaxID=152421 RepID=A0AAV5MLQ2_9ROSI|nr:hypothetical protein SLEP1_g56665 [Rubroshorea leprosula]
MIWKLFVNYGFLVKSRMVLSPIWSCFTVPASRRFINVSTC